MWSVLQDCILYEEPSSSSLMSLNKDGGAVFLTQPDGSTQLVLLTPDQKQQVSNAKALKQSSQKSDTYQVRPWILAAPCENCTAHFLLRQTCETLSAFKHNFLHLWLELKLSKDDCRDLSLHAMHAFLLARPDCQSHPTQGIDGSFSSKKFN